MKLSHQADLQGSTFRKQGWPNYVHSNNATYESFVPPLQYTAMRNNMNNKSCAAIALLHKQEANSKRVPGIKASPSAHIIELGSGLHSCNGGAFAHQITTETDILNNKKMVKEIEKKILRC